TDSDDKANQTISIPWPVGIRCCADAIAAGIMSRTGSGMGRVLSWQRLERTLTLYSWPRHLVILVTPRRRPRQLSLCCGQGLRRDHLRRPGRQAGQGADRVRQVRAVRPVNAARLDVEEQLLLFCIASAGPSRDPRCGGAT